MSRQRHQQVKRLFLAASELDSGRVEAYLDQECADDPELRAEVESLLNYHYPTTIIGEPSQDTKAAKIASPLANLEFDEERIGEGEPSVTGDSSAKDSSHSRYHYQPGRIVAGRYRILGPLGRGGMGEVYRAEDLKLEQDVALKFLLRGRADGQWLAGFRNEVRLARRVTHPNVNRIYDIVESEGESFISMEYVDGEDLASLLRRIGRISVDKAVQIAGGLCGGLGAAHDRGVLHRDLKPANTMIDGEGRVRITDFGIASIASERNESVPLAGTPAYMAPELFEGRPPSKQSDLFSLGIVLYETVTGRHPFGGNRPYGAPEQPSPTVPSALCPEISPAFENIILQCLQRDPKKRPHSTHVVAAALPGGDPLSAVIAAGETPSPSLVAASSSGRPLGRGAAAAWLLAGFVGLLMIVLLADRTMFLPQAGLVKSPGVLADYANRFITKLGYEPILDGRRHRFRIDRGYLDYMLADERRHRSWDHMELCQPAAVYFWYRQGDDRLVTPGPLGEPTSVNLPPQPGMHSVRLDPRGRLLEFATISSSPGSFSGASKTRQPDWSVPFAMAGLQLSAFQSTDPVRAPPMYADIVTAWRGVYPDNPDVPVRIEGAAIDGRVVYFEVVPPWEEEQDLADVRLLSARIPSRTFFARFILYISAIVGGSILAWRNLRCQRGDVVGARRLALAVFALGVLDWVFGERHLSVPFEEAMSFYLWLARATTAAVIMWICYVALEPYVRRLWPRAMVTWGRLLRGRLHDPLIGRDMLFGLMFGIGLVLMLQVDSLLPVWLGRAAGVPKLPGPGYELGELLGMRYKLGTVISVLLNSISLGLVFLLVMMMFRVILRLPWLATASFWALLTTLLAVTSTYDTFLPWVTGGAFALGILLMLERVGLVAVIVGLLTHTLIMVAPITTDFGAWYSRASIFTLVVISALLVFAFSAAMAGRSILAPNLLDEYA